MSLRTLPLAGGGQPTGGTEARHHPEVAVSLAFIATGLGGVVAGGALLVAWGPQVVAPGGWAGPHALALTHVLAVKVTIAGATLHAAEVLRLVAARRDRSPGPSPPGRWRERASSSPGPGDRRDAVEQRRGGVARRLALLGCAAAVVAVSLVSLRGLRTHR